MRTRASQSSYKSERIVLIFGETSPIFVKIFRLYSLLKMDNVEGKMENLDVSDKKAKRGKKSKEKADICDAQLEVGQSQTICV